MDSQNKKYIYKYSIVLAIIGTIFGGLAFASTNIVTERIIFGVVAAILFIVAGIYLFLENNKIDKNINLFLFDDKNQRNRKVDDLTFENICETLDIYIPLYIYSNTGDIWFDRNISARFKAESNKSLTKLIYYRILYLWIENSDNSEYKKFGNLSKEDLGYIVDFMAEMGENEISEKLYYLSSIYDGNTEGLKDFFENKKEYLEKLIVNYVKENIDNFKFN